MTTKTPAPPTLRQRLRNPLVIGSLAAVGSIMAYGASQVVTRSLVVGAAPPQVGSAITLFTGMTVLFFASLPNLRRDLRAPKRSLFWVALAGLLASNGAFLSFIALSQAPVVVISPIVAISPLLTLVLMAVFLRQVERITPRVLIGSLLVIGGVVLVIFGNRG